MNGFSTYIFHLQLKFALKAAQPTRRGEGHPKSGEGGTQKGGEGHSERGEGHPERGGGGTQKGEGGLSISQPFIPWAVHRFQLHGVENCNFFWIYIFQPLELYKFMSIFNHLRCTEVVSYQT